MTLPLRTRLELAVIDVLAQKFSGVPVVRARRSEVAEHERPLVHVATGNMTVAYDDDVVLGHVRLEPEVIVRIYPAAAASDVAALDAAAQMEAMAAEALHGRRLTAPGGEELTDRLEVLETDVLFYDADATASRVAEVELRFRARCLVPQGLFYL